MRWVPALHIPNFVITIPAGLLWVPAHRSSRRLPLTISLYAHTVILTISTGIIAHTRIILALHVFHRLLKARPENLMKVVHTQVHSTHHPWTNTK